MTNPLVAIARVWLRTRLVRALDRDCACGRVADWHGRYQHAPRWARVLWWWCTIGLRRWCYHADGTAAADLRRLDAATWARQHAIRTEPLPDWERELRREQE